MPQSSDRPESDSTRESSLAEELEAIPYERLLPVEKKLILWSLSLGVVLLAILLWASATLSDRRACCREMIPDIIDIRDRN